MEGVPFGFVDYFGTDFGLEFVKVLVDQGQAIFSGLGDGALDDLPFFFDVVANIVLDRQVSTSHTLSCSMSSTCSLILSLYLV